MDVKESIIRRRSIRNYKDIPIPRDILVDMMVAGQHAPTAGNLQNWRFVVVDDEVLKAKIADACFEQTWMKTAPIYIIVFMDHDKMKRFYGERADKYCHQTAAAVAENMLLTAQSEGISSCWVSAFNDELVSQAIGAPAHFKPEVILTIGYANERVPVPAKIELPVIVFKNRWGALGRVVEDYFLFNDFVSMREKVTKGLTRGVRGTLKSVKDHIVARMNKDK